MMQTLPALRARRLDLMDRLAKGDAKCFAHDPLYGNGPDTWTKLWLGYLDEYEATEQAIARHTEQPALMGVGR